MVYEYNVIAGKGNSSAGSLAQAAQEKAEAFYGELPFEVTVEVTGKTNDYYIRCQARAKIEVV